MTAIASTLKSASPTQDAVPFPPSPSDTSETEYYSIGSLSPARSSAASISSTLIESEDDDMRILRRLLTGKIDEQMDSAFEEIDAVFTWLRIAQDGLRALRRRTRTMALRL